MRNIGRRIAVIGPPGSGKSTMSLKLGKITHFKVYHMDKLYWKPGWTEPDRAEFEKSVLDIVNLETWIIDGNYSAWLEPRIEKADTILFLDFKKGIRTYRILKRIVKWHGRTRPDMSDDCIERFELEFLRFVWNYGKTERPKTLRLLEETKVENKVITLRNSYEVTNFLSEIESME